MAKLNAALRLSAEIVAPATDFKKENESDLKKQQNTRENEENKPSVEDKTEVRDNPTTTESASTARSRLTKSAYTPEDADPTLDTDKVQTASVKTKAVFRLFASRLETESDPLTMDESEDACLTADSTVDIDGLSELEDGFAVEDEDGDNQTHDQTNADVFTTAGPPSTADDNDTDYTDGIPLELDDQEVLSDADPTLYNMAQPPAGGTC